MNHESLERIELLKALGDLSRIRPEWRMGQTLANLAMLAGRMDAGGVWDLEDAEALEAIRAFIREDAERNAEEPVLTHS